jgi:hypothetical protein
LTAALPGRDIRLADRREQAMSDSGTEAELRPCAIEYLESLGSDPDVFRRRYPNTFEAFSGLTCPQIEVLNTIGAALALDNPKGDHYKGTGEEDTADADAAEDAVEKLNKYLYALH